MLTIHKVDNGFIPGNQKAIDIILNQYNTNLKSMI